MLDTCTRIYTEDIEEVDVERDVIGTGLYRERTVVEEVEERRPKRPTKEVLREEREVRKLERALRRELAHRDSWLRGTLVYKTFYDMVCNRVGVIVAGFGIAMTLFTVFYDVLQGESISFGARHMAALVVSLVVYFTGMGLEALRIWSWECDGVEEAPEVDAVVPNGQRGQVEEEGHIPMIPQEAIDDILNGSDGEGGTDRAG